MQRFETKYDLLEAAYIDESLKKGTIALLQYLVYKSNKEQCFPAVDTIAKALNVCKRTVQYNMRKLESAGYIIRKDRWYNHQQLTNQYVFNLGIKDEMPGKMKFTEEEYNSLNDSSFIIPDKQMHKIDEIQKIYSMKLSAREKLLLIYLYHRANKKGLVYDKPQTFMEAIGVRENTLKRILNLLRKKGLLKVKHIILHGQDHLVMQLTGNTYQISDQKEGVVESKQKTSSDHNQDSGKIIQNPQNQIIKKFRKWLCGKNNQIRNFLFCMKKYLRFNWHRIRKILRI